MVSAVDQKKQRGDCDVSFGARKAAGEKRCWRGASGKVQFGGIVREVCLDLLPEAEAGQYLLVHVGYAISLVDEEEARKSYEYMELAGMLEGELTAFPEDGPTPVIEALPPVDDFAPT